MTRFFIFAASILFSNIQAEIFDLEAEQQIFDCLRSKEFSSMTVRYRFEGDEYPIEIVHNPNKEYLWNDERLAPTALALMIKADLPFRLIRHLEDLFDELGTEQADSHIDLKGFSTENFTLLHPVSIANKIDEPDARVRAAFSSTVFTNEVFYYYLEGKYYKVRILHNPEERSFSATKRYRLALDRPAADYTISWKYKYGIIVDEQAPQELIDHLAELAQTSWWDWYFNFKIYNGSYVEYKEHNYGFNSTTTTTYYLDTWFNFTDDLH